MNKKEN